MIKSRHVVVTGGGRGIGADIARRFRANGDRVTLMARTRNEIETLADEIGAYAVRIDVGDPASVEAAFMAAGPVDVLVNNAGMIRTSLVTKTDVRVWEEHLRVNLTGSFLCALKVLPGMLSRGKGRIVNISSVAGNKGYPYMAAYCASKHGLIGFTRALATEVAARGVTVNAVCPGYIDTPMLRTAADNVAEKSGREKDLIMAMFRGQNPAGRFFTGAEVAEAVVFLASEAAAGINGQTLTIDGGELAGALPAGAADAEG
jgi:NAD(P)-dependent dehydrogenase (short-subunit alcohol dehydrogenase family)